MTTLPHLLALRERATPHEKWAECSTPEANTKQVYTSGGEWSGEWVASFARIEDAEFAMALVNAFPSLVARLQAAEAVAVAVIEEQIALQRNDHLGDERTLWLAVEASERLGRSVEAWRLTRDSESNEQEPK